MPAASTVPALALRAHVPKQAHAGATTMQLRPEVKVSTRMQLRPEVLSAHVVQSARNPPNGSRGCQEG